MAYNREQRRKVKPADTPLAIALARLVNEVGMSYREMGEAVGSGHSTAMGWIRTGSRPEPDVWPGIAKVLGWSTEEVQEALGLGNAKDRATNPSLLPEGAGELLRLYEATDERGRRLLLRLARITAETADEEDEPSSLRKVAEEPGRYRAGRAQAGAG